MNNRSKKRKTSFWDKRFHNKMEKKLAILYLFVMLAFLVLIGRIVVINIIDGEAYSKQVLAQQNQSETTIPYKRGDILDVNGTVLATSNRVYHVILDVPQLLGVSEEKTIEGMSDSEKAIMEAAQSHTMVALEEIFGIAPEEVEKAIEERPDSKYVILLKNVDYETRIAFHEYKEELDDREKEFYSEINKLEKENEVDYSTVEVIAKMEDQELYPFVRGVWLEEDYLRDYPYDSLASTVIGFSNASNVGSAGIEQYYNEMLNGLDGREYSYFAGSQVEVAIQEPQNGNNIVTTIDYTVQSIVEKHILAFNEEHENGAQTGFGSKNTAVLVTNPNTNEIIASANYPNYDLNNPGQLSPYYTEEEIEVLRAETPTLETLAEEAEEVAEAEVVVEETEDAEVAETDEEEDKKLIQIIEEQALEEIAQEEIERQEKGESEWSEVEKELLVEARIQEIIDERVYSEMLNRIRTNYTVTNSYEPGSTVKPFTVATAYELGLLDGTETYYCGGSKEVADYTIHCANRNGHGTQTLVEAMANSCNVAMMDIAEEIGIESFTKYQDIFGIGELTGIDVPNEISASALIYTEETMQPVDLATNSFGQSFNMTMVQLMSGFNALVNGGDYYEPYIVKQIQDESGRVLENIEPALVSRIVSEETSMEMRISLKEVVEEGTGGTAAVEGYSVGGKTGTAEKLPRGANTYLVSFIACVPAENPEVSIYVVIDEPNVDIQANSALAQQLAADIMEEILPYLGVTKDPNYVEEESADDTEETVTEDTTEDTEEAATEDTTEDAEEAVAEDTENE